MPLGLGERLLGDPEPLPPSGRAIGAITGRVIGPGSTDVDVRRLLGGGPIG